MTLEPLTIADGIYVGIWPFFAALSFFVLGWLIAYMSYGRW